MLKRTLFVLLVSLCLSQTARADDFPMQSFSLDNGLQVVVIENHKAPIVKHMVFYKAGASFEKPGKGGVAHLLEHLMFRGTQKVKGQTFNRILEENGADSNAFTAQDMTAYHQFLDLSRLELALFLEADRMQGLQISDADFEAEREIVFQERKQRVDNNPSALFIEKVKKVLWQDHPYGQPVTGQDEEIRALTKEDVLTFYRQYYAPNNAVVVLSGDIDVSTAKKLVQKYYGALKPTQFNQPSFKSLPKGYRVKVEMNLPEVRAERYLKVFAVPSIVQNPDMAYALDVLSEYLTGDENAPLHQKLVLERQQALNVSASYDGVARSYGTFILSVVPKSKINEFFEKQLEKAVDEALYSMTEDKIEKVKKKMLAELVYLKDNPSTLATLAGYTLATGGSLDDLQRYAQRIEKVDLKAVWNAAEEMRRFAPQVTGILRPEEKGHE